MGRRLVVLALACMSCMGTLMALMSLHGNREATLHGVHGAIEEIEREWREGPGHQYIQDLADSTLVHQDHWRPWAIIFVHVPRTGGDALYTHLFPTDDAYLGDAWWGETHLPRFYDDLGAHGDHNWTSPKRRALYKGFISGADMEKLHDGPWKQDWHRVRTFTILRDPVERVLSAVKHMQKNGIRICNRKLQDMLRAHSCSGLRYLEEKLQSYLHNGLAYQLGDRLNVTLRRKSPAEAVASAKELLKSMDFIGFYEDWQYDYYLLREEIFHDFEAQADGPQSLTRTVWSAFRRWIFYMGTVVARPRMRTRKYAAQVTNERDWEMLRMHTRYDQEVYDFARELTGRNVNPFYNNYGEFLLYEGPVMLVWAAPFLFLCGFCCLICFRQLRSSWLCLPFRPCLRMYSPKDVHVA